MFTNQGYGNPNQQWVPYNPTPVYNRDGFLTHCLVEDNEDQNNGENQMFGMNLSNLVDFDSDKEEIWHGTEKLDEAFHKEPEPDPIMWDGFDERNYVAQEEEGYSFNNDNLPEYIDVDLDDIPVMHPNPDYGNMNQNTFIMDNNRTVMPTTMPVSPNPQYYPVVNQVSNGFDVRNVYNTPTTLPNWGGSFYDNGVNPNIFGSSRIVTRVNPNVTPSINQIRQQEEMNNPPRPQVKDLGNGYKQVGNHKPYKDVSVDQDGGMSFHLMNIPVFKEGYNGMANAGQYANVVRNQAMVGNPTMLEYGGVPNNIVDFSNPESVNLMQNPFGRSPFMNPNIQQQPQNPYSYNPYQAMNNASWYGSPIGMANNLGYGFGYGNSELDRSLMRPTKEDIDKGRAVIAKVTTEDDRLTHKAEQSEQAECSMKRLSYFERLLKPVVVRVVTVDDTDEEKNINEDKSSGIEKEKNANDEKIVDDMQLVHDHMELFEIPQDTKLNWTEDDEENLSRLADEIAIYNKALAHVIYNAPCLQGMTREKFNFYIEFVKEELDKLKSMEKEYPEVDFRVEYRYRKLPDYHYSDGGSLKINADKPENYPNIIYDKDGNRIYPYDRGREPNKKEWDIFYSKELLRLRNAEKKKRIAWLMKYNAEKIKNKLNEGRNDNGRSNSMHSDRGLLDLIPRSNESHEKCEQEFYVQNSWYDFLNQRRKMVENQKYVYMCAFNRSMTPEQFNEFWNGPQSVPKQYDPEEQRRMQIQRMTASNIGTLQRAKVIDYTQISNRLFQEENKRLKEFDHGCMDNAKNLQDYFDNLGYLLTMCHEDNIKQQRAEAEYKINNNYNYQKNLVNFANNQNNVNYRPIVPGQNYSFGNYTNYVDLTNSEAYKRAKAQFMDYCNNSHGDLHLKPTYY